MSRPAIETSTSVAPPRRPRGVQVRRLLTWLGAGTFGLALFSVVTISPAPFSRVYDNSKATWESISAIDDDGRVKTSSGNVYAVLATDRDELKSFGWLLNAPTYRGVFVESRTADDGQASLFFFYKFGYCGNGLSTWNPLDRSLPLYSRSTPLRVAAVGGEFSPE